MSRASDIISLSEKRSGVTAVNLIIKTVKGWGGFSVGSVPLAKELGFDPIKVNDILLALSKKGYLDRKSPGVYRITPQMQDVEGIDTRGKLQIRKGSVPPGTQKIDWAANFWR